VQEIVVTRAARCYGVAPAQLTPLDGGHFTHVYGFTRDGQEYVLRITPPNEEMDARSTLAYLEWMAFLADGGACVPRPSLSAEGRLLELIEGEDGSYIATVVEKARGVLGQELPLEQWTDALYEQLGRVVGRMHALAGKYAPSDTTLRRPAWDQIGNCFHPGEPLEDAAVAARREEVLRAASALPTDAEGYGLIHADLHFANLFVEPESGRITVFDFDDCAYGWYAMDIAMGLFDILVLHPQEGRQAFAGRFLESYLRGYLAEKPLDVCWIERLPLFLKLVETGVYTQVYRYYDSQEPDADPWVSSFMGGEPDRRARILGGVPYVELDWRGIWERAQSSL